MSSSCPQCDSKAFKRNGYTRHGKQNHRCLDCGRQFSLEPAEQSSDALLLKNLIGETGPESVLSYIYSDQGLGS